jgi:hypothetical protein
VEHHACRISGLIARLVDGAHDELPLAGINVALQLHNVADLQIIAVGDVDADDGGIALAPERFELLRLDDELRVHFKETVRVYGQTGKELVFVDVDTREPRGVGYLVDAWNLRDLVAVGQRQSKHERNCVTGDQSVGGGRLDAGVPGGHYRLQQCKRHHGEADPDDGQQAAQLMAQGVAKQQSQKLHSNLV